MEKIILLACFLGLAYASTNSTCVDHVLCKNYPQGYCHHIWLREHCRTKCGYCQKECKDKIHSCDKIKLFCDHPYMRISCAKFCGHCKVPTTNQPITTSNQPITTTNKPVSTPNTPTISSTVNPPTNHPPTPQLCGRQIVPMSRVIGGKNAAPHSWPWQIGLHLSGRFICGGSLINSQWVVTAAHCVHRRLTEDFKIKLGDHNRQVNEGEQMIEASKIIEHPGYGRLNNDIALIKLKQPAIFNDHVQPVCLPDQGEKPAIGSKCYITGWGKMRHPGSSVPILQQLALSIQSNEDCQKKQGHVTTITNQMICAANTNTTQNQSGCHGDSGGPFVCQQPGGTWKLQGAVSWGSPRCDIKEAFTVYARVAEFRNWIDMNLSNSDD